MITHHGYNHGHNNPMYNAHKNVVLHYTWQMTVCEIQKTNTQRKQNRNKLIDTEDKLMVARGEGG